MRVLHIGINAIPNLAIARAFRECGHEVVSIDWKDKAGTHAALKAAIANPPDLCFLQLQSAGAVESNQIAKLKAAGTFVVNWTGDVRHPLPLHYVEMAQHVNVTAFTNVPDVEEMCAMGHDARFLQVGYDELIYRADGPIAKGPPVVFMGNNYTDRFPMSEARSKMVAHMRAALGADFAVYGSGWGQSKRLNPEEEAARYRGALVAINFDHYSRHGFFSDRRLRAMACGVALVNAPAYGWDFDRMAKACRTYLDNPLAAKLHGDEAAEHAYTHERWHNRVKVLEEWTNEHKNG